MRIVKVICDRCEQPIKELMYAISMLVPGTRGDPTLQLDLCDKCAGEVRAFARGHRE
jgi:hypothetical protein